MSFGGFGATAQAAQPYSAANASVDARASFITKTYLHLVGAVFAFVFLEVGIFLTGLDAAFMNFYMTLPGNFGWLLVLGAFIAAGYVANNWATNATSSSKAYAGLGLYVLAEAVIFIPLLHMAVYYTSPEVLPTAGLTTLLVFGGLTGIVFVTRKDFSFLRGILGIAALGALGLIVCSILFGFKLGVIFSGAMVVLAGGYTLYYTSNVLHHYRTDQHVAASLALFSAVALMFWYILRIFMSRR